MLQRWGSQSGLRQHNTKRVGITAGRHPPQQRCLYECRAAPHERIIDRLCRASETLDKETRQLRFETSSIRNLVETAGRTLSRGPKLIDVGRNVQSFPRERQRIDFNGLRGFAKFLKTN